MGIGIQMNEQWTEGFGDKDTHLKNQLGSNPARNPSSRLIRKLRLQDESAWSRFANFHAWLVRLWCLNSGVPESE